MRNDTRGIKAYISMSRYRMFFLGIGILVTLLSIFLGNFILNLPYPLGIMHGDAFLVNFILNHYIEAFRAGDFSHIATLPMFWGFSHSLFFTEFYPIHGVAAYVLSFFTHNIFLISNVLILATVLFSAVSMYALCWYIFRRIGPSIVGALIFTINPFLMARFPDHALLLAVGWIPLSILCIEQAIRNPKGKSILLLFLVLIGQLLTSSLHYSIFLTVILPVYIGIRLWQEKVPVALFVRPSAGVGLVIFIVVATTVGSLYMRAYKTESLGRTIETSYTYSARLTDWVFTAPQNMLYGDLKAYWADRLPAAVHMGIYSEQNLFTGIVPGILAIVCIVLFKKLKQKKLLIAIVVVGCIAWVLSFGPRIVIYDGVHVPGLYGVIYHINPLFSYLRVPARFGIFVFLAIGLCSGGILSYIGRRVGVWLFRIMLLITTVGIMSEYWQKPLEFTHISPDIHAAYAPLKSRTDITVILDLPIGNSINYSYPQARAEDLDARYLLWALMLHDKTLFNGYSGFLPKEYYARANALSVAFPTRAKVADLKKWGVDTIVLHRDEFNDAAEFMRISEGLKQLGVDILSRTDGLILFDLTTWKEAQ